MAKPDKSKLHGTEFAIFNDELPMPKKHKAKSIIKDEDNKPKAHRKHFKEKLASDELASFTCIDWVEYFIYKCNGYGFQYFRGQKGSIINENKIISNLMKDYTPEQIKNIFDFMWDIWDNPKIDKRTMRISILSTGWMQEIFNLTESWSKGDSVNRNIDKPNTTREWRGTKTVEVEPTTPVKKSKITIGGK